MADKRIQDLPSATSVQLNDLLVLEQSGAAMNVSGQILVRDLATALDGHGGISDISYDAPVSPSLEGTLTVTLADGTDYTVPVLNGNGISSIDVAYGISYQSTNPSYVSAWYAVVTEATPQNPYQWTRFTITDETGNDTVAYAVTRIADNPTITVGDVTAESGPDAGATVTNSGTAYNPVFDFDFTLPQGDKGDTGDYIEPSVSYGTSTAAATEPSTWYSSPTSISYAAGNFIWRKTQYVLHDAQTVQDTKTEIIGYIGQNGSGSGTVQQITFNGTVFADDGTGNVPVTVNPEDVGAIADPDTKSDGQVLTYDSTADKWVASTPSTGSVNTVNNVGVTVGTTNIQLYGTAIPMSSTDSTSVKDAIPLASNTNPADLGTASPGVGTTWARSDHVHKMPSASDVGAASASDVKYKIYNSVTDLGLTSGSATIAGAYAAMPDASILICNRDEFVVGEGGVPSEGGTVEIVKNAYNRGYIRFYGRVTGTGDRRMFLNSSNVPDGKWNAQTKSIPGLLDTDTVAQLRTKAAAETLYFWSKWGASTYSPEQQTRQWTYLFLRSDRDNTNMYDWFLAFNGWNIYIYDGSAGAWKKVALSNV